MKLIHLTEDGGNGLSLFVNADHIISFRRTSDGIRTMITFARDAWTIVLETPAQIAAQIMDESVDERISAEAQRALWPPVVVGGIAGVAEEIQAAYFMTRAEQLRDALDGR